ncbi:hypothetical protein [Thermocoleostomius sinensis]|uniref:Uncharacterized protein n=1 Tax=Thermocoleostomius sinensis A174 TaxID=2016057 RepID=A0A9E8Z9W7_9CYAN|nr:hypothetical protein [Thermocoleostomius sinensis]WAL58942.1 hypothetical protein OXH18_17420 [Thermocoleostomius sinensis A174]
MANITLDRRSVDRPDLSQSDMNKQGRRSYSASNPPIAPAPFKFRKAQI